MSLSQTVSSVATIWLLLRSMMIRHRASGSGMNWVCGMTCISIPFTSPENTDSTTSETKIFVFIKYFYWNICHSSICILTETNYWNKFAVSIPCFNTPLHKTVKEKEKNTIEGVSDFIHTNLTSISYYFLVICQHL